MRYASIAVGAMLGANLRYVVANWATDRWGADFPYGTFLINVTGAFVIGVFLALISDRLTVNPLWRLFFATGFLGGYTNVQQLHMGGALAGPDGRLDARGGLCARQQCSRAGGRMGRTSLTRLLPF